MNADLTQSLTGAAVFLVETYFVILRFSKLY